MMKILLVLLLLFTLFLPTQAFAQQDDPKFLTNCNERAYCDDDGTTWVRKSGCRIAKQFEETCSDGEANCRTNGGNFCICNFDRLPNSCGNRGGINDASTNSVDSVFGRINPPEQIRSLGDGEGAINNVLQRVIQLIYIAAGIGFVIMFVWSAFQLITSGGNKEGIAAARQRITWSIVGIALLALAFPIFRILEEILGFKFFG